MIKSERILQIRNILHLSQIELSNMLDVSSQTVARWESGKMPPSMREEMIFSGLEKIIGIGKNIDLEKIKYISQHKGGITSLVGLVGVIKEYETFERNSNLEHIRSSMTIFFNSIPISYILGKETIDLVMRSFLDFFTKAEK